MKVLIVDDWQFRHDWIHRVFRDAGVYTANFVSRYSPAEVTLDDMDGADLIFLDHDMCRSGGDLEAPCPNPKPNSTNSLNPYCGCPTGMDMVDRIIQRGRSVKCVVHTANPPAGSRMSAALKQAGFQTAYTPAIGENMYSAQALARIWGAV